MNSNYGKVFNTEKPFAKNLRYLLDKNNETHQQLADALGKQRQTISLYVNGNINPDIYTLITIAKRYNVSIDWLLGMPNSAMKIDNDKNTVMKYLCVSEKAIDTLRNVCLEHSRAVDLLLSFPDEFRFAMKDLDNAINLSYHFLSDAYYLIPAYNYDSILENIDDSIQRNKDDYPTIIEINQLVRHLISSAFDEMQTPVQNNILENTYKTMHEAWAEELKELKGGDFDGNSTTPEK